MKQPQLTLHRYHLLTSNGIYALWVRPTETARTT